MPCLLAGKTGKRNRKKGKALPKPNTSYRTHREKGKKAKGERQKAKARYPIPNT
jgi:hypothetical protein